jgi:hypothetical protein
MLKDKISSDLKDAMRAKDELALSVLRMLSGAIKNREIAARDGGAGESLSDEQVIEVIQSEIKKRNDSVTSYLSGGRNELADKETSEIKILERYMPPQLSDEEIENEVRAIAAGLGNIGPGDFGRVMGQAMGRLKGKADGNKVGEAVKRILGK